MGLVKSYADAPIKPQEELNQENAKTQSVSAQQPVSATTASNYVPAIQAQPLTGAAPLKAYPLTGPLAQGAPAMGVPVGFQPQQRPSMAPQASPYTPSSYHQAPAQAPATYAQPANPSQQYPISPVSNHPAGYRQSTTYDGSAIDYGNDEKTAAETAADLWETTSKTVSKSVGVAAEKVSELSETAKQWFKS